MKNLVNLIQFVNFERSCQQTVTAKMTKCNQNDHKQ